MIKNKTFDMKEIKIKIIIVSVLFAMVIFSFFFAENIEKFLKLKGFYNINQTSAENISQSDYEVHYLDVGQGNSAYIKLPDNKVVLIDGGNVMYGNKVVAFLKDKNVKTIDYLIATHADADHIGGLISVLEEFEVKNIYRPFQISGTGESAETFVANKSEDLASVYQSYVDSTNNRAKISRVSSSVYAKFIELIYDEYYFENNKKFFSNITVFYDGLTIENKNYSFEFFAPLVRDEKLNLETVSNRTSGYATVGYGADESNGSSAIFLFSCYGDTFLFTGDAPFADENVAKNEKFEELDFVESLTDLEKLQLQDVSVYLLGHHGSKYSSGRDLLSIINPRFAVVSVGLNNDYNHPSSDALNRLVQTLNLEEDYLLRTDYCGNIAFINIDGKLKYVCETYEKDNNLSISWYELGTIIFISLSYLVVLIKINKNNKI